MTDMKTAIRVAEKSENIQDIFLNNARRDRALVALQLMNGQRMSGKISSFDRFSLVIEANHQEHLVFKHAIATITLQARGGSGGGNGTAHAANHDSEG
jgi:host factor-I protein